jgi:hypothetical protein
MFCGAVVNTESVKTWQKTRLQNLVRHKSSGYYARLFLNGKEIWKSLKTSHFSVAEAKLAEVQKEHRERRGKEIDPANAKITFGQALALHMQRIAESVTLKRKSRECIKQALTGQTLPIEQHYADFAACERAIADFPEARKPLVAAVKEAEAKLAKFRKDNDLAED